MMFSPDSKQFAYVWQEATCRSQERVSLILADTLEVRWFPTAHPESERSLQLTSVDLHAMGGSIYPLEARLYFSPDSMRLAAVSAEAVLLVDMASGLYRRLSYSQEWFTDLHWTSAQEIAFATIKDEVSSFWRLNVVSDEGRRLVYHETTPLHTTHLAGDRPLGLAHLSWSPNGRLVVWGKNLLDVMSGTLRPLPLTPEDTYWRPDSSALLIQQTFPAQQTLLVDAATGTVWDMSKQIQNSVGDFGVEGWTAEGRLIIGYSWSVNQKPSETTPPHDRGYLVQPRPFKVVMRTDALLRKTPLPGWVLVQGEDTMKWTDYAGVQSAPIEGWPNDWMWSQDGSYAAEVRDGEVHVFRPKLPQ